MIQPVDLRPQRGAFFSNMEYATFDAERLWGEYDYLL
jgi:hypothetical protein